MVPRSGPSALITTLVVVTATIGVVSIGVWGHDWINGEQAIKVVLWCIASIAYMGVFYCLGAALTARSRVLANGLVAALVVWLVVVLIIPQIGDTMDPDNQVPGGLFAALNLDKPHETRILAKFGTYERAAQRHRRALVCQALRALRLRHPRCQGQISRHVDRVNSPPQTRSDIIWMLAYVVVLAGALRMTVGSPPAQSGGDDA